MGLFAQAMVERDVARLLDLPVDLIFDHAIRPDLETCILEEAVPL